MIFSVFQKNWVFGYLWSTLLWYRCYYPHQSRDALSPVCRIFLSLSWLIYIDLGWYWLILLDLAWPWVIKWCQEGVQWCQDDVKLCQENFRWCYEGVKRCQEARKNIFPKMCQLWLYWAMFPYFCIEYFVFITRSTISAVLQIPEIWSERFTQVCVPWFQWGCASSNKINYSRTLNKKCL